MNKREELWYDFLDFPVIEFFVDIPHKIQRFFEKIWKILCYAPLLFRDEDWSPEYMIDLLNYKLRRVAECLKNGHTVEGPNSAKKILEAVRLLEKTTDEDNYCHDEYKAHEKKWGKLKTNLCEKWTDEDEKKWILLKGITKKQLAEDEANKGLYTTHKSYYPKAKTRREENAASKELFNIFKKQQEELQKDLDNAFNIIAKNINGWSD